MGRTPNDHVAQTPNCLCPSEREGGKILHLPGARAQATIACIHSLYMYRTTNTPFVFYVAKEIYKVHVCFVEGLNR